MRRKGDVHEKGMSGGVEQEERMSGAGEDEEWSRRRGGVEQEKGRSGGVTTSPSLHSPPHQYTLLYLPYLSHLYSVSAGLLVGGTYLEHSLS